MLMFTEIKIKDIYVKISKIDFNKEKNRKSKGLKTKKINPWSLKWKILGS